MARESLLSRDPEWRGEFTNVEVNRLHAQAFSHGVLEIDWVGQVESHSLGWVTCRVDSKLVGFVNVAWDGGVHAFLLDTIVDQSLRRHGLGRMLVETAAAGAKLAGCEWLHVDFEEPLTPFYIHACGFQVAPAGVLRLIDGM